MKRVVVVGGGIDGLIAAEAFRQQGAKVALIEPNVVGGEFLAGNTKTIRKSHSVIDLMNKLDVPWSDHTISSGIMLRGNIIKYPECIDAMPARDFAKIHADFYKKTRRVQIPEVGERAMTEPGTGKNDRRAIRCDPWTLIKALESKANVWKKTPLSILEDRVLLEGGQELGFDCCVVTQPLWAIARLVKWRLPDVLAMSLNILRVLPKEDPYVRWDSIYTPYTPKDTIHRVSVYESSWDCEFNGDFDENYQNALNDLGFLFPNGFRIQRGYSRLKGHMFPLNETIKWPENLVPMGRYAKWDSRVTPDKTLDESIKLAQKWI